MLAQFCHPDTRAGRTTHQNRASENLVTATSLSALNCKCCIIHCKTTNWYCRKIYANSIICIISKFSIISAYKLMLDVLSFELSHCRSCYINSLAQTPIPYKFYPLNFSDDAVDIIGLDFIYLKYLWFAVKFIFINFCWICLFKSGRVLSCDSYLWQN